MSPLEIAWFLMMPICALAFAGAAVYLTRGKPERVRNTQSKRRGH